MPPGTQQLSFCIRGKEGRESRDSLGGRGARRCCRALRRAASLPRCVCVPSSHTVVPHGGRMRREHCDGQQQHSEVSTHTHMRALTALFLARMGAR